MIEPLSRNSDPMPSHHGADYIASRMETQVAQIYDALKLHPMHTARELADATGIDYHMIAKRLPVLRSRNLARVVCTRTCTVSKTKLKAQVWEACP